jgi:hypothetical protein
VLNDYKVETESAYLMLGGTFLGSSELLSIGALRDMNLYVTGPEKEAAFEEAD